MSVSAFQPLDQLHLLRKDKSLTSTQRHVLNMAVLRTDNLTRQVRCSQELLADDAGVGHATVERVLKAPAVRRYFVMERDGRRLNLTWRMLDLTPLTESTTPLTVREESPHSEGPSASSASTSAKESFTCVTGREQELGEETFSDFNEYMNHLIDLYGPPCKMCGSFPPECRCNGVSGGDPQYVERITREEQP